MLSGSDLMKTKSLVVGGTALLLLTGLAVSVGVKARRQPNSPRPIVPVSQKERVPAKTPAGSADLIPIMHLEMRDRLVTVRSGPAGLVYLIQTKDGKVLHENLSEEQLKAQAPEIHDLIKTAVAGSTDHSFMDARH